MKPKTPTAILVYLLIFAVIFQLPPRWGSNSGTAALIDKHRRLELLHSPKIIIVGGSNVSVGIDGALLENTYLIPVVNMGLGASLGLRYMLAEISENVQKGDVVLVSPEYDYFCRQTKQESNFQLNGSSDLIHIPQVFPGALRWVLAVYLASVETAISGLGDLLQFFHNKFAFYVTAGKKIGSGTRFDSLGLFEPVGSIYTRRENYDTYGDFIGHLNLPSPGCIGAGFLVSGEFHFNDKATKLLDAFGSEMKRRGAEVVVLPPPVPDWIYETHGPLLEYIFTRWKDMRNVILLGSPKRYSFPNVEIFDTPYHLNRVGRERRTQKIIEDLRTVLRATEAGASHPSRF